MDEVVRIDRGLCNGCESCVDMCPRRILFINGDGVCDVSDHSLCDRAGGCEYACPEGAIRIV